MDHNRSKHRLIVDGMLGSLARKLRLLGYDTLYVGGVDDRRLLELADSSGRILITGDVRLYEDASRRGVKALFVESSDDLSLAYILRGLGVKYVNIDPTTARCPHCNTPVTVIKDKELVRGRVPRKVLDSVDEFYVCLECGRIYWVGRQWGNIKKLERKLNALLEEEDDGVVHA